MAKVWNMVKSYVLEAIEMGIEWLEDTSATYRDVIEALKHQGDAEIVEGNQKFKTNDSDVYVYTIQ